MRAASPDGPLTGEALTLTPGWHIRAPGTTTAPASRSRSPPGRTCTPSARCAGTPVTELMPDSHRHHLGVSLAVPDVDGANFWGGRTFVARPRPGVAGQPR